METVPTRDELTQLTTELLSSAAVSVHTVHHLLRHAGEGDLAASATDLYEQIAEWQAAFLAISDEWFEDDDEDDDDRVVFTRDPAWGGKALGLDVGFVVVEPETGNTLETADDEQIVFSREGLPLVFPTEEAAQMVADHVGMDAAVVPLTL